MMYRPGVALRAGLIRHTPHEPVPAFTCMTVGAVLFQNRMRTGQPSGAVDGAIQGRRAQYPKCRSSDRSESNPQLPLPEGMGSLEVVELQFANNACALFIHGNSGVV